MSASARSDRRAAGGVYVLAGALPLLFLHARYTPGFTVAVGSTDVAVRLSDAALALVAAAGAHAWRTRGPGRLASARAVWLSGAALLGLALASAAWGPLVTDGYPLAGNAVSAAKFAEWALLAPAVVLLVRSRRDLRLLIGAATAWALLAAAVGALQFVGILGDLDDTPAWRRKPSFLGYHDFAALAAAVLLVAVVGIVLAEEDRRARVLRRLAAAAGAAGLVLAGSVAAAAGAVVGTAGVLGVLAADRRLHARNALLAAALVCVAVAGTAAMRSGDIAAFARFVGLERSAEDRNEVQTYSHRTVLAYVGVRIAAAHPLTGAGWQGSALPASFEPYLADARARFPDVAPEAFPSRERRWGVQNAYVQAAADMGVPGLLALLALLAAAVVVALRRARRTAALGALVALGWLAVAAAELAALGLVPGVPLMALLWLAVGLAVASPVVSEEEV